MAYFQVKNFAIYYNSIMYPVLDELKNFICSEKYHLNNSNATHYNPHAFFEYIKFISKNHPDVPYIVYYKYIYHNHTHINEYQNKMFVINGVITDKLL
jgi:hypothetical protein